MQYVFNDDILIPLGIFAMVVLVVWIKVKFNAGTREIANRERMALIEKGVYDFPMEEVKKGINLLRCLFWGFAITGLGAGLIIAFIVLYIYKGKFEEGLITFGSMFLCSGIGMLIFYKIAVKREKEEKANSNQEQLTE